jgi:hypothetical protein
MSAEQYIYLMSNVSPSDTQCEFTTHLAEDVYVNREKYKIGVAEIIYEHSFSLFDDIDDRIVRYTGGSFKIPDQHYEDAESLLNVINTHFISIGRKDVNLHLNKDDSKVTFTCVGFRVVFTTFISEILGFIVDTEAKTVFENEEYTGLKRVDIKAGHKLLLIYSNVVQESLIGNTRAPILRILAITGKDGELITHPFPTILYKDLKLSHLSPMTISIRNETGASFRFRSGIVMVALHLTLKL